MQAPNPSQPGQNPDIAPTEKYPSKPPSVQFNAATQASGKYPALSPGQNPPPPPPPVPFQAQPSGQYPAQKSTPNNGTTVIAPQPGFISSSTIIRFIETPMTITCPSCKAHVVSSIQHTVGTLIWILFVGMFCCGLWICCFIPFCVNSCKDVLHTCPKCSVTLGLYRRL